MSNTLQLTCRHCYTTNRVPAQRLAHQPKCGRCHNLLFTGEPLELDEAGFNAFLTRNQIPLLIDFWASWCSPCMQMAPAFADAARVLEPQMMLGKVNTEKNGGLAAQFGIRSLPTIVLFADGREIGRQIGGLSKAAIVQWAKSHTVPST